MSQSAVVSFPVPSAHQRGRHRRLGYGDGVVFPVTVTPVDRGKPSVLHADVTYAVCNKICVPGHGEATLTLMPRGAPVGGDDVTAALAKVPKPVPSAPLSIARVSGTSDPTWTLSWNGADAPDDIFPDAPEGFYFDTKKIAPAQMDDHGPAERHGAESAERSRCRWFWHAPRTRRASPKHSTWANRRSKRAPQQRSAAMSIEVGGKIPGRHVFRHDRGWPGAAHHWRDLSRPQGGADRRARRLHPDLLDEPPAALHRRHRPVEGQKASTRWW